jgi:predicted O-methyltransferase YrrM
MKMVENIVSFPPEVNEKVGQYCIDHSMSLPGHFKEHKEYTEQNAINTSSSLPLKANQDKMVSTLQAQLFVWLASDRKARKILEIGCFSGIISLSLSNTRILCTSLGRRTKRSRRRRGTSP